MTSSLSLWLKFFVAVMCDEVEECMWGCILSISFTTMKLNLTQWSQNLKCCKSNKRFYFKKIFNLFSLVIYRILVGAPTAESVMQPGLRKAGAVYRCSSTQSDSCQQLPFDRQGTVHDGFYVKDVYKTAWIEGIDKTKWVWMSTSLENEKMNKIKSQITQITIYTGFVFRETVLLNM